MSGERHGFRLCTEARYLGGYLGDNKSKRNWLRVRTLTWDNNINMISKTTGKYPQDIYAADVCAIQSESIFLQCITCDTGDLFVRVEKMISEKNIWFFLWKDEKPLPRCRSSNYNADQKIRTGNPESSDVSSGKTVTGGGKFSNSDHLWTLIEEWRDRKKSRDVAYESRIKGLVINLQVNDKHLLLRAKSTGASMSVRGTTVSGTVLSAT